MTGLPSKLWLEIPDGEIHLFGPFKVDVDWEVHLTDEGRVRFKRCHAKAGTVGDGSEGYERPEFDINELPKRFREPAIEAIKGHRDKLENRAEEFTELLGEDDG